MNKWLIMKTPGFLTDTLFYLRTLTVVSVSSIALQISSTVGSTSAENTFTNYENLEVEVGALKVRATGKNTTEVLMNLMQSAVQLGSNTFFRREILSVHASKGKTNYEETRHFFISNVLTEALDDGTPAYYNSNILGRYYRKDYFDFGNDSGVDAC